jgi:hypothetical protein
MTPNRIERGPSDRTNLAMLSLPLALVVKGYEAWQDRTARRNYEGPTARAARLGSWTCTLCGSEGQGDVCGTCRARR